MALMNGTDRATGPERDPLWYKDAIFYEVRVRSLYDSNGDGIGDFPGLTAKLDYFRDLGVTTLWLLPFYPSPMHDDGYDIADYCSIHPDCGTLDDFVRFLEEAHKRSLRVVTELVLNHTSDQHPWFQRARRARPGSLERDFYVWNPTPDRYSEARIIFKDFETSNWAWDPVAGAYYWHRFYTHQPDLNFDNPAVHEAIFGVVDFWLGMGVDGLRLDAVPYLYEREGTNCENLPETYAFLRELRRHVDARHDSRMLLAEANQWPEDAVLYFDGGRSCHMAFHFPIMPRLFMSVRAEDRFPLTDIWAETPGIADNCQWALFLRNHDELTLEMVTDEERDYMYRAYARERRMRINLGIRRRLAPLLGNDRRTIELMNGLLFSLPGTPVIYYGDEIGMGDNVYLGDRDGVRTPMQWSSERNAGFSQANPQQLILPAVIDHEYHYQTVNVEAQEQNRHSLLWWMRRLIVLRKQFRALSRGTIEFLNPDNAKILTFVRSYENEHILVVANLSRFAQPTEFDLSRWKGLVPTELAGATTFPAIDDRPYPMVLGPHMFLWFELASSPSGASTESVHRVPTFELDGEFSDLVHGGLRRLLEGIVVRYLTPRRSMDTKARVPRSARMIESIPLHTTPDGPVLALFETEYDTGEPDASTIPLAFLTDAEAADTRQKFPDRILAELTLGSGTGGGGRQRQGVLCDATTVPACILGLFTVLDENRQIAGDSGGTLSGERTPLYETLRGRSDERLAPHPMRAEQSNASVVLGDRLLLKIFRRLDDGINPEFEIGRFLTTHGFASTPQVAGAIEYRKRGAETRTIAVAHEFVQNEGDAWQYTRQELRRYFERAATRRDVVSIAPPCERWVELAYDRDPPSSICDRIGAYLDVARLLGRHLAELHLALASTADDPDFAPEAYSVLYQRSVYQSMRNVSARALRLVRSSLPGFDGRSRLLAEQLLARSETIRAIFETFYRCRISALRLRLHGNLHLGNWLYTGRDFLIIDFEGETGRPISDRRRKRSCLRDVATMLCSLHEAAVSSLVDSVRAGALGEYSYEALEPSARLWHTWCSRAFLREYLTRAEGAAFLPHSKEEMLVLLDAFRLERTLRQLGRALIGPDQKQARVFLEGLQQLVGWA